MKEWERSVGALVVKKENHEDTKGPYCFFFVSLCLGGDEGAGRMAPQVALLLPIREPACMLALAEEQ
jgi:hypothetical protein